MGVTVVTAGTPWYSNALESEPERESSVLVTAIVAKAALPPGAAGVVHVMLVASG